MAYVYDDELTDRLTYAILKAVWDASKAPGRDVANIRPRETLHALMAVMAQTLAMCPPDRGDMNGLVDVLANELETRVPGAKELAQGRRLM